MTERQQVAPKAEAESEVCLGCETSDEALEAVGALATAALTTIHSLSC